MNPDHFFYSINSFTIYNEYELIQSIGNAKILLQLSYIVVS